ncbi:response regulator transcription factor [Halobacillus salinarum]|uniref:Response regulator transcription factor n=1 Tax=Halobacillus salinarum TaxID=2932257 RepID=A0ABY4EIS1_9BACI|nr:response regulator transcription factor [Halobacillus salinarum]UOQ43865.1 response regulator transcription factor [Halobacillus salinarum]
MNRLLIVEDEPTISRVLTAYLRKNHFLVSQAFTGAEARKLFKSERPSLVLLDVMLPDEDGWSILHDIRSESSCPIIMLTALSEIDSRLKGLQEGADDYISKPFIGEEVVARIQAVLRRPSVMVNDGRSFRYGSLHINTESHQITLAGNELSITPRDRNLLIFLAEHPNQTFSRAQLLDKVWGMDYKGSDRAVDLSVKRIRKALKPWTESEGSIKTLRGLGYQLSVQTKK